MGEADLREDGVAAAGEPELVTGCRRVEQARVVRRIRAMIRARDAMFPMPEAELVALERAGSEYFERLRTRLDRMGKRRV